MAARNAAYNEMIRTSQPAAAAFFGFSSVDPILSPTPQLVLQIELMLPFSIPSAIHVVLNIVFAGVAAIAVIVVKCCIGLACVPILSQIIASVIVFLALIDE